MNGLIGSKDMTNSPTGSDSYFQIFFQLFNPHTSFTQVPSTLPSGSIGVDLILCPRTLHRVCPVLHLREIEIAYSNLRSESLGPT